MPIIGFLPERPEDEYATAVSVARKTAVEMIGVIRQAERFGAEAFGGSDARVHEAARCRRVMEAVALQFGAKNSEVWPTPASEKRKEQETHGD